VLRANLELRYYENDSEKRPGTGDGQPLGVIDCRTATSVDCMFGDGTTFGFTLTCPDRTWVMDAESDADRTKWMKILFDIINKTSEVATPFFEVLKQGWLSKKGEVVENWKQRWIVLSTSSLFYFVDEDDAKKFIAGADEVLANIKPEVLELAKGHFSLVNSSVKKLGMFDLEEGTFAFSVKTPAREYFFVGTCFLFCIAARIVGIQF
jgi:hypothetical protein